MRKKKRLGQHFLVSQSAAKKIVDAAQITKKDTVLEIGTGKGILVPLLCDKAGHVISIESDYTLYSIVAKKFSDVPNLTLLHGDGFKSDEKFSIFVSNLPYSKSRDAMEWLVQKKFRLAVVMVQKEFFLKILEKNTKAISVLVNYSADIEKIMHVSASNFSPPPKVDSIVLRLTCKKTISKALIQTVNLLYSYKRKKLSNIARQFGKNIESDKRLEDLSGDEIINLAKKLL
ncbi:MAG TPA: rRNA adenine N-6-methyltransferase family protein [Nitrosopumilaceae archaeon]|nr:rRNA adenine N-6-methyltransferase family protein [Nitrosopumilaceae archaeon]